MKKIFVVKIRVNDSSDPVELSDLNGRLNGLDVVAAFWEEENPITRSGRWKD